MILTCGSGARCSVLSGKRHQGRTVQQAEKQLAARLLVGDADFSIAGWRFRKVNFDDAAGTSFPGKFQILLKNLRRVVDTAIGDQSNTPQIAHQ